MEYFDQPKEDLVKALEQLSRDYESLRMLYIKEQDCHDQISEIVSNISLSRDEVFELILQTIHKSLRLPEVMQVSVHIYDRVYQTPHYKKGNQSIQQNILLAAQIIGLIEVNYPNENKGAIDPIFLPEESYFLRSIAHRLSNFIEQNEINSALRASEAKFSKLMDNINDVIYTTDELANITYISPSIQKLLGYTQEEVIGKNFTMFIGNKSEYVSRRFEEIQKSFSLQNEYHVISKTGEFHWIRFSSKAIIKEGQFLGVTGVLIDVTETKKIELELQKSEETYRKLVESINDIVFDISLDGTIKYVSPSIKKMLSSEPEQLVGRNFFSFVHPDDKLFLLDVFKNDRFEEYGQIEYRCVNEEGKIVWIQGSAQYSYEQGEKVGRTGILHDITEKKQAEEKLRKSEEQHRRLVESVNDVIYEIDATGVIKFVSPSVSKILGYSAEEVIGRNIFEFIYPADVPLIQTSLAHLDAKDYNYMEYRYLRKNGTVHWVRSSTSAISENGVMVGATGILTDITERMTTQEALSKSEERFSQIAAQSNIVVWEIDDSGLYTYVNDLAEKIWGFKPDEIIGQKYFFDLHPEENRAEFKRTALEAIHRHEKFSDFNNQIITKDNRLIWVSTNGIPVRDHQNNLIGYRGADIDITERLMAEKVLRKREKELNEAQEIAQMCSWELDPYTEKLSWSENYYRIMGIPFGTDMKTNFFLERVHPDDLQLVNEKYKELLQTKKPIQYDIRLKMPDNQYNWIQNNIVPKFKDGKLVSLRGVNIDITDKKLDEEKIKDQNEKLNAILAAIPDLIFVMTSDGTYLEFFATESQKLLIEPESIIGSNIRQLFDGEMTTIFLQKISNSLRHKKVEEVNYEIKLPSSPSTHFEARIAPLDEDKVLILSRDVTEKVKNEIEIKKLSLVVEQSPVITMITDLNSRIEYVNPAFETTTGYSFEEVVGRNANILQSGMTDTKLYAQMWDSIKNGKEWHGEWVSKRKNGELYWEEVAISPIFDSAGKLINYLAIKQNINERKKTEDFLKQSEKSYRHMFGNNPQPMWIYDLETLAFLEVNDAAIKHYGYSRKEFRSMTLRDIRPAEDLEALMNDIEISKKRDNKAGEWRHLKKNGEMINVEISSHAITFNDRQARHILVKDITERKKIEKEILDLNSNLEQKIEERTTQLNNLNASLLKEIEYRKRTEAALSESEKSYRMVVENVKEIFFQTDREGRLLFLNKSWEEVTGFSVTESLGNPFLNYAHPDDSEINLAQFLPLITGEKDTLRHQARFVTNEGEYRWLEVFARPGINEQGQITGSYGTIQDITERKKSNEMIQNARLEAEQANLAKSEFLSRMSHELRTPMNSILGFAQLLELGDLTPKQRKSIDHILRSGRHLLQLINEVLDISRIEAGHLTIHLEPISINRLNQEIVDIVTPMASVRQIKLEISASPDGDWLVNSDNQRLKQVMLNLTNNAIKYNRIGGSVFIHSEVLLSGDNRTEMVRISVIDTGIGIKASDIPNIFTPFERIGAERSGIEGTGLGLAVVNKIMKALGGKIGVESSPGEGSKFWIELPRLTRVEKPVESSIAKSKPLKSNDNGKILYIEDNISNFELVEQFLAFQRPEIELITNIYGKMAVPLAIKYRPDLILLDLNLPDIDGNRVLELLLAEEKTSTIPVVIISADAMPERFDILMKSGAKQFLTKPLNLADLLSVVDNYLKT